ncbi:TPA: hypothetical protein SIA62_004060 [Pseudomonas aeruginosa]|uniref:hypothetical protein n=1 Tax=Pseudomonas aeruginosa TaxID=287 RepID=UPI00136612B9|nr:hypothetical protein [Pseudomonas aeruginosa]MCT5581718.1 hypothetical protein [Pseudomonas aeruginosa]MCV0242289.1 hypothetical protein [Pseudomonas aeruginosa]HBO1843014.1 hypothetical protein [Pseudomonas aeruginosa]HCE9302822.1 hypothetical protein [Pseudomonas aeruginosa]HDQ4525676.1 hypothetical protein [Pseudomonas aeruginosa]
MRASDQAGSAALQGHVMVFSSVFGILANVGIEPVTSAMLALIATVVFATL